MLLVLLQTAQPADEFGSPIVLFLLVVFLLACVAVAGAISGAFLAIAGVILLGVLIAACMVVAVGCLNLALATIVWTRRPRTRAWFGCGWWGTLTLFTGPVAAATFWWLHYVRRAAPRCYACGYDLSAPAPRPPAGMGLLRPECAAPRRAPLSAA